MSKKEGKNPITAELCLAYRNAIKAEIKGVKNTIIVGLSISTAVISIIMFILSLG